MKSFIIRVKKSPPAFDTSKYQILAKLLPSVLLFLVLIYFSIKTFKFPLHKPLSPEMPSSTPPAYHKPLHQSHPLRFGKHHTLPGTRAPA